MLGCTTSEVANVSVVTAKMTVSPPFRPAVTKLAPSAMTTSTSPATSVCNACTPPAVRNSSVSSPRWRNRSVSWATYSGR